MSTVRTRVIIKSYNCPRLFGALIYLPLVDMDQEDEIDQEQRLINEGKLRLAFFWTRRH